MATLYALAKVSAFGKGPSNQLAPQREAVKTIAACGKDTSPAAVSTCLADAYARRNNDLAIAVAVQAPDRALPVVRRNDPVYSAVLEAILLWASEPHNADWSAPARAAKRDHILVLLRPSTTLIFSGDEASGAAGILGDDHDQPVRGPADLFRSDRRIAAFLNALGPYLPDEQGHRNGGGAFSRPIPCAAIVRHPALLGATTSLYGSTMDNFVFYNDCRVTLPPLPRLDALDAALKKNWPPCEGTIRFAAYRAAMTAYDEARLGLAAHDRDAWPRERYGVSAAMLQGVHAELTQYYATYLGKRAEAGRVMADDSLKGIFATAHQCE